MWNVDQIETVSVILDGTSSGSGQRSATAAEAGGVLLVNDIELVEVELSATQVQVCEDCGVPHCNPGGWVAFRRIGENVVWIPAWREMEESEWGFPQYGPPSYLTSDRVPRFSPASWERLRTIIADLATAGELSPLDSREAARWCQWTAPGQILGEFPAKPRLNREALLASSDGELDSDAETIDSFLKELHDPAMPMKPLSSPDLSPIELWIDLPGTPSWTGFARVGGTVCLLIDGELALVRESDG